MCCSGAARASGARWILCDREDSRESREDRGRSPGRHALRALSFRLEGARRVGYVVRHERKHATRPNVARGGVSRPAWFLAALQPAWLCVSSVPIWPLPHTDPSLEPVRRAGRALSLRALCAWQAPAYSASPPKRDTPCASLKELPECALLNQRGRSGRLRPRQLHSTPGKRSCSLQKTSLHVRNRILDARLRKALQAQQAALTSAARLVFELVAGPGQLKRRPQAHAKLHNFLLP